jgi:signal transduction histidine kinase
MPAGEALYDRLHMLAVEDPKQARKVFLEAFESGSEELSPLFVALDRPSEGRLRQVVANALRNHPEKTRALPQLFRWRDTETDEFTRRAIDGALSDVDQRFVPAGGSHQNIGGPSELGDVYRYVADRLRHRLRNTMLSAQAQTARLKRLTGPNADANVQTVVAKLDDAIVSMGRQVEATDVDPAYFQPRSVLLPDWLREMNSRYANQYSPINLKLINTDGVSTRIFANDYLLETVFWNIWLNAHQATGPNCDIIVEFARKGNQVEFRISDNGQGFSNELRDVVFQQIYSTRGGSRGRGLLEIQDAVERLGGHIELYEARPAEYRILMMLPMDLQ